MALTKENIVRPVLPRETVAVQALGGDVVVQGLTLSARLALHSGTAERYDRLPKALAMCVVGEDGLPLMDEADWNVFGGAFPAAAFALWSVIQRLSGLDAEAVEKN